MMFRQQVRSASRKGTQEWARLHKPWPGIRYLRLNIKIEGGFPSSIFLFCFLYSYTYQAIIVRIICVYPIQTTHIRRISAIANISIIGFFILSSPFILTECNKLTHKLINGFFSNRLDNMIPYELAGCFLTLTIGAGKFRIIPHTMIE